MIIATLSCETPKPIEELEEHVCRALIHTLHIEGPCALLPALPLPLESYILAALIARNAHSKGTRIARRLSLEILARMLAHRQLSNIISLVKEFAKDNAFVLILFSSPNEESSPYIYEKLKEALSTVSCTLTAYRIEDKDRASQLIRSIHNVPQEYITLQLAVTFSGCSTVLIH